MRALMRLGTSLLLLTALGWLLLLTARDAGRVAPSAAGLAAVYAQGAFYALVLVGLALAVYVASRAGD